MQKDRFGLRTLLPGGEKRLVLDEIHRYPRWRNLVKGLYQVHLGERDYVASGGTRVLPFRTFCKELKLP